MKKYFGNYLGLVVDDRDPENRGRTKVFIPHVMPALYESWNKEGKDITFNITDSGLPSGLDTKIVDRLQKILPWAECAAPIFGAGPAGKYDYSSGSLRADVQNVGNRRFDTLQTGGPLPVVDSPESQARAANAIKNGLLYQSSQSLCARGANNILSHYVFGKGMATSGANARDMGPVLESRYSMSEVTDVGVYQNGDTRILTGPGFTQHIETYMNGKWYSDFPQNNSSVSNPRYNTAKLYRLPTSTIDLANGKPTSTIDLANGNAPEVNPSVDPPPADINMVQPDKETGTVQDSGTLQVAGYDEQGNPLYENLPGSAGTATQTLPDSGTINEENFAPEFKDQYDRVSNALTGSKFDPAANGGQKIKPEDGETYGIYEGTKEEWAHFFTRLASVESSFNSNVQADINGFQPSQKGYNGVTTSYGLYQLGDERFKAGQDKFNPDVNTQVFVDYAEILYFGDQYGGKNSISSLGAGYGPIANITEGDYSNENQRQLLAENMGSSESQTGRYLASAVAQQPTIPHTTPVASVGGPNTNYMPTGMFGGARTGQTVWVFFQEGNPLFPVYFAAAYGEKEWANINQASSPGLKNPFDSIQNVDLNMSLDAGGITSKQIISNQKSGFEKDDFVFQVYGKNGSALTFTFLATLLNSKYDFRQHTQGDAHYITGGNRTDRTTGDHTIVCEQDLIITVGNWSQEALDAANEIQGVIDEAMKAAKDTYESNGGGGSGGGSGVESSSMPPYRDPLRGTIAESANTGYTNPFTGTDAQFDAPINLNLTNSRAGASNYSGLNASNPSMNIFGDAGSAPSISVSAPSAPSISVSAPATDSINTNK